MALTRREEWFSPPRFATGAAPPLTFTSHRAVPNFLKANAARMTGLEESDWEILLDRIRGGRCTPFLGAGACFGALPLGGEVARALAAKFSYPLGSSSDLTAVTQYLSIVRDPAFAKSQVLDVLKKAGPPDYRQPPDFTAPDEPHALLADLPLPVYMTTNYDPFLFLALKHRHKDPRRELCRWNKLIEHEPSVFEDEPNYTPTLANPLVYHLHGHDECPDSVVATEDDYLKFLAKMAGDPKLLPEKVQRAMRASSFLFIGYRVADWNFRILFEGLRMRGSFKSIAVLVPPRADEPGSASVQSYMERYYDEMDIRIFWGTAREFSAELRRRWQN